MAVRVEAIRYESVNHESVQLMYSLHVVVWVGGYVRPALIWQRNVLKLNLGTYSCSY